jgi:UPF0755 protein
MVTLASIVEKETGKPEERPRVAGVFINRLDKHMRLDSDPTIVYGLAQGKGTLGRSITRADLNQSTPYNTYIIDGLPPGPICNPGKAALEAVAKPARSKELYFVADGSGGHAFAETLDQHQKNVARWRQIEKDVKDKLAPDVTPAIRGSIDPVDPAQFGALAAPAQGQAAPASILARMTKIGAERNVKDGPLLVAPAIKSIRAANAVAVGAKEWPPESAAGGEGNAAPVASAPSSSALFGALVAPAQGQAPASVLARLGKIGADRNAKDAALASLVGPGVKTIEELGAVVAGVNDGPAEGLAFGNDDPPETGAGGPIASAPLSPAMLADQKAREAKYGTATLVSNVAIDTASAAPAQAQPATASGRPRIYDASEGTPLDPLLNKTYDLSYAKVVPADAMLK